MTHASPPMLPPAPAGGRWTLEQKLALLTAVILAIVIALFGTAAYREMRSASVERAVNRLEGVASQLATTSATSSAARLGQLRALATDPRVVRAIRGDRGADSAALMMLRPAEGLRADSTLMATELWSADARPMVRTGVLSARDSAVLAGAISEAVRVSAPRRSPLYGSGGRVHVWTVVPITVRGRVTGVLAEHRRLGANPRVEETLRGLVGEDVSLYFTNEGTTEWASVRGIPVEAPFALPISHGATLVRDGAGDVQYVAHANVPGTPWIIVLSEPERIVLARPREFLRFTLGLGALLLAAAIAATWLLGRRLTRPLRAITGAAGALAVGDYSRRVEVTGARELAQLGSTFNEMAARIGQAHAALEERNTALEQANAAKARFLAMMSHELRTPLNAIGGYTELLELGLRGPVTEAQVEDLARIRRNRDHLLSIITDILSFARADAGQLTLHMADIPVQRVLADTQGALGHQHEALGVTVTFEDVSPDLLVRADRDKLQQVLVNLVTNAVRFTDSGGEVRVSAERRGDLVMFRVRDTGIGIEQEKLERIFEPFVQVDSSLTRKVGGTGLGLAIARELAGAMGGRLTVESAVGEGSTFIVELRAAGDPAPSSPRAIGPVSLAG